MPSAMALTQLESVERGREAEAAALLVSLRDAQALSMQCYRGVDPPSSLALFETLSSLRAMPDSAGALRAAGGFQFARHLGEPVSDDGKSQVPAPFLMIVAFDVPAERSEEVDLWYEREHIPLLLKAKGWLRSRRYRAVSSQGAARWTSLALHDLGDLETLDSAERAFARSTPWRARLENETWFKRAGRWVYQRVDCDRLSS